MTTAQSLRPPQHEPPSESSVSQSTLFGAASFVRGNWRGLAAAAFLGFALGAGGSFLLAPRFRSQARVALPPRATPANLGVLGSLSAAFGISIASADYSPEFVTALARGRNVLDSVLRIPVVPRPGTSRSLATYLTGKDSLEERDWERARKRFQARLRNNLDIRTGIVELSFWDTSPEIAARTLEAMLDETNRQLMTFQRSFALARRDYLDARVGEAQAELQAHEQELARFREANRDVSNSPLLQLETDRLTRRVNMALQSYTALQQQLDAAELEVRSDIPQLMIIETPDVPVRKYFPRRRIMALGAAALAALLFAAWTATRQTRRNPE